LVVVITVPSSIDRLEKQTWWRGWWAREVKDTDTGRLPEKVVDVPLEASDFVLEYVVLERFVIVGDGRLETVVRLVSLRSR
jgi:hypothetical protein